MALLQAWPGRGFWQGQPTRIATPGSLTGMVQQMATTPQPHLLSSWVTAFGTFDAAHGWGVNLFSVLALASDRDALPHLTAPASSCRGRRGTVLCLADWVLVQDFGFFGGVGTDPNSMVPMALVFIAGYLAVTRLPAQAPARAKGAAAAPRSWRERLAANPDLHLPFGSGLGRARRNPDRDRPDGPRSYQPSLRRPGPRSSRRRHSSSLRLHRTCPQPGRPVRPPGLARKPARQSGRARRSSTLSARRTARSSLQSSGRSTRSSEPRPAASTSLRSAPTPSSSPRSTWLPSTARKASKECRTGCSSQAPCPSSNTRGGYWGRLSNTYQAVRWSTTASSHT